jgi:hypothetical protein
MLGKDGTWLFKNSNSLETTVLTRLLKVAEAKFTRQTGIIINKTNKRGILPGSPPA